jgi:hypothetical protein
MSSKHLPALLFLALAAAAPDASAQFQWKDENGRMVYSDMAPPNSIAPSAVIRSPGRAAAVNAPSAPANAGEASGAAQGAVQAAPAARPPTAAAPSAADRELEFRKRRMERADAERKATDATQQAQRRTSACEDARSSVRTLESGMRVSRVNEQGEREAISESQRASRLDAARRDVKDNCGA